MSEPQVRSYQALRFLFAGGLAALINWLARFPIGMLVSFEAAVALAQIVGWGCGFVLYRAFVFSSNDTPLMTQIGRFLAVNMASGVLTLAIASLAMHGLVHLIDPSFAQALAHGGAIGLGAVMNFFGHARITFAVRNTAVRDAST